MSHLSRRYLRLVQIVLAFGVALSSQAFAGQSTYTLIDTLGAATPATQFQLAGSGGQAVSSYQNLGPMFVVEHPTVITEIGAFVTYCELLYGATECPSTLPLVVQIRPAVNGQPDLNHVLGSYVLPVPQNPQVHSYQAVHPNLALRPGTYFAIFGVQDDGLGGLMSFATDPFDYQAGVTTIGFVFSDGRTGTGELNLAVRVLGKHGLGLGALEKGGK